jgi:hypothetical protein
VERLFFYVKRAGQDGLPIVALLSFLLGMIIAFMSSLQLKQFGANLYVASLVGFGMVRELGPIITAIIFAGRSGSAFAADKANQLVVGIDRRSRAITSELRDTSENLQKASETLQTLLDRLNTTPSDLIFSSPPAVRRQ